MEDVWILFVKAIAFALKYLKIGIDWSLEKCEKIIQDLDNKMKAKAAARDADTISHIDIAKEIKETESVASPVESEKTNSEETPSE